MKVGRAGFLTFATNRLLSGRKAIASFLSIILATCLQEMQEKQRFSELRTDKLEFEIPEITGIRQ